MSLRALLAEVDPGWLEDAGAPLDAALAARARDSALGRRLLASWLAGGPAASLLAPDPARVPGDIRKRWPRPRLDALCRDLGLLAHAPPIRAEVRREPVRRLKAALGHSYMLALDRTVWEGTLPPERLQALGASFNTALAATMARDDPAPLFAIFDRQGRAELRAWARRRDPALADWSGLLHPPAEQLPPYLPEKPVLRVYTHHEARAA
ncbi:hypothetical protein [Luteimonas terricola]|uniref:Uncharacterized protein n=1 Tax=Luteimonas terricola TaxID=645597 RepID=A0ABQ2E670_9GAMM|nr:hypothetical protein [Luteimonas terricola]GGJ96267.1 hypothetical protein GCM10011394_01300 [Luteimonas terricola]